MLTGMLTRASTAAAAGELKCLSADVPLKTTFMTNLVTADGVKH